MDGSLLRQGLDALSRLADSFDVIFPLHPRTRARIDALDDPVHLNTRLRLLEWLGYLDFLSLSTAAACAVTDSGGVQEETTSLGVPCFTLRANTERPMTLELETNTLLDLDPWRIVDIPTLLAANGSRPGQIPAGWDGHAADRIMAVLEETLPG